MFCQNCGKQLPDGSRFCEFCGAQIVASPAQQPPQQPVQQQYQQPYIQPTAYPQQPRKKTPWGLIGGCAAAVAVLAVVLFVYPGILRDNKTTPPEEPPIAQTTPAQTQQMPAPSANSGGSLLDLSPTTQPATEPAAEPEPAQEPAPQSGTAAIASDDPNDLSDADKSALAASYSTDESGSAMEFEWFLDKLLFDGRGYAEEFAAGYVLRDPLLLEGGWKAYLRGDGRNGNDVERYLNAEINSFGNDVKVTLNWKYVLIDSQSYEEDGSSVFSGTWNGVSAHLTGSGALELTEFGTFGDKQYSLGTFMWPSGETDYLALVRP